MIFKLQKSYLPGVAAQFSIHLGEYMHTHPLGLTSDSVSTLAALFCAPHTPPCPSLRSVPRPPVPPDAQT